jgi:outer membrane immunogenic protein
MRNVLGLVGASLFFAGPAFAADLVMNANTPPAPAPAFGWTGCYLGFGGGLIGGGRIAFDLGPSGNYLNPPGGAAPPNAAGTGNFADDNAKLSHSYASSPSSGEAGVQVGCNKQVGWVVFGAEADWQWSGLGTDVAASYGASANLGSMGLSDPAHIETVTARIDWFSTFRARVGFTPLDRVLIFGTAGLVVADVKSETAVDFGTLAVPAAFNGASHAGSTNQGLPGFVIGAGVEWGFASNWSVKAEYLYFQLPDFNYISPLPATAPVAPGYAWGTKVRMDESVVRAGLNFHF